MSNPTTPFSWQMPTATDLVTDLPADFEVFGQAVATSMADLLGGPSGYILSKASATDMDFTWIANDQGDITGVTAGTGIAIASPTGPVPTVTNSMATTIDAKGDLVVGTGSDAFARLAAGNNGEALYADSSAATGLRYVATPSASNPVLNSAMNVAQRGTTFTTITGSTYTLDRWNAFRGAGTQYNVSQQSTSDTTNLPFIQFCSRVGRPTGNTALNAVFYAQSFETLNSRPFAGKVVTVSFYARAGANFSAASNALTVEVATGTGTDQNIISGFTGAALVVNQTATLTTTWQRFSYVSSTLSSSMTQLGLDFYYTPVGTAGAADYFEVTGVQLDIGNVALPFRTDGTTYQQELAACQRYFYKTFPQATTPAQNAGTTGCIQVPQVVTGATNQAVTNVRFPVTMRATPTITIFNPSAANAQFRNGNGGNDWSSSATEAIGDSGVAFQGTGNAAANAGARCQFHITADIEL